jgi:hypothetical protein
MIDTEKELLALLAAIADTEADELDCDAFLARAGAFAEQVSDASELSDAFFAEAHHIRICPACREEFRALLTVLKAQ